jgi:phosphohistidine phosphatase
MLLYLVRHAWAGDHGDPRWPDDNLRPLTKDGMKRFGTVTRHLVSVGFSPGLVATSPLVRARQTAEILVRYLSEEPEFMELEELAPGSQLERLLAWTNQHARGRDVAWVGHAPDIGIWAGGLLGAAPSAFRFSKGSVAAIEFEDRLDRGAGELRWHVTARVLGA